MEESKSNIIDNRLFFLGKMDTDKSPEYQENGTYGRAYNINPINYDGNYVGNLTNVAGNVEVDYTFEGLTSDPFIRVLGSKLDEKRRRLYFLILGQNSGSDQYAYVLYYSYETGDITTVFSYDNILDFNVNFPIDNIDLIYDDELGDTLFWTDGNSEPKKLNIDAGVNRFNNYTADTSGFESGDIVFADTEGDISNALIFIPCQANTSTNTFPEYNYTTGELNTTDFDTLPVGQCYPPFLVRTMFYQKPITPYWSPISTYEYDGNTEEGASTFLRRRSFQVRYKYVYFDGQESEWSPISEAVFSQELTSGIFNEGATAINPDFPDPSSISLRIPIHSFRGVGDGVEGLDVEDIVEFPHAMIARVKIALREVPTVRTPTDWLQLADISFEEFYKYNLSDSNLSNGFPALDIAGTYYYNWDTQSYNISPAGEISRIRYLTFSYDGSQTLTPIDVADTAALFYRIPKKSNTQTIGDNRIWHGNITDGMDISKDVVDSIEDNISFSSIEISTDFNTSQVITPINEYNVGASSGSGTQIVTVEYDLVDPFVVGDFDTTLQYSFRISLVFSFEAAIIGTITSFNLSPQISGITSGVPDDYATFEEFIEDIVNSAFSEYSDIITASVDNSTGKLTITINSNSAGIDTVLTSAGTLENSGFYTSESYLPERTFKNHSIQQYGWVFQDDAGRLSPVVTGDWGKVEIPHFYENTGSGFIANKYKVQASNLTEISVPTDARVAHLVRKRSESWSNFIQFPLSSTNTFEGNWNFDKPYVVGFVNLELDEQGTESLIDNKNLYISLNAVNGGDGRAYESVFDTSILDFLPQSGDIVRFLYKMDVDGNVDELYNASFNIERYDERTNSIVLNFEDIEENESTLASYLESNYSEDEEWTVRVMVEVVQQPKENDQEFYWEVAAQLSCTDGAIDINSDRDRILLYGDTYLKLRGYCINYYSGTLNTPDIFQNFVVQDKNYNDFAPSNNVGEGRPNKQIRGLRRGQNYYVETQRDNVFYYSEKSVQNTDIRNYGTVYDTNLQEVDNVFGRIELLDAEGDTLSILQEDKLSRALIGRSITTELSGAERVIATQNNVTSDVVYNNFNGGISIESESFAKSGYQKYFTDTKRGKVYRQSLDGITEISEVGMSGYFKQVFRKVRNSFTTPTVRGIVDERTDEYILSITYSESEEVTVVGADAFQFRFQKPSDAVSYTSFGAGQSILIDIGGVGKFTPTAFEIFANETPSGVISVTQNPLNRLEIGDTLRASIPKNVTLVYSERTKGWTTFLNYTPEWLEGGIQSYHSFENGIMWLHDLDNTDYNSFFGTVTDSEVVVYGNKAPELTKYFRTIAAKTKAQNIEIAEGDILTSEEQTSHLPAAVWVNKEGTQHAPFYGEGTGTEINSGNKLRGRWIKTNIIIPTDPSSDNEWKLFGVAFISGESGLTY